MSTVTFNIPKSWSFSSYHYNEHVKPVLAQLVEILNQMGEKEQYYRDGNEYIVVGTTQNSIYLERRNRSYNRTESKIKSFMFGKEHTITRQCLADLIEQEKERLSSVQDQKSKIETIKNAVKGLIPENVSVEEVTESKILLRMGSSYLPVYTDGSGSVNHKLYLSTFGVTTEQLKRHYEECVQNEIILNEVKVKLLTEIKGFFKN